MSEQQASGGSGLQPNVASLLSYLCSPLTAVIFLIIEKENKAVRFHALQALILLGAAMILYVGLAIVGGILAILAKFLGAIFGFLTMLVGFGYVALWVVCMVKAYKGEQYKVPYIGDIAEKQANK